VARRARVTVRASDLRVWHVESLSPALRLDDEFVQSDDDILERQWRG
jgi:hypothetical protein